VKIYKFFVLALLVMPAAVSYATPNLRSTPQSPYGPFIAGQMPTFYYNLLNTGTTDNGTRPPGMNSNWVAVDLYSDNNYPSGKGPHGGWQWISGDGFGPVPAGGSIRVNNGGSGTLRWPENDYCLPAGNHRVQAFIDNDNDVVETNNGDNNSGWTSFTVNPRTAPAPDLTAAPSATPFGPFVAGMTATIPFRFSNIGTAVPTALLRARAQIDDYNNGSGFPSVYIRNRPVLAVGETRVENFAWDNAPAGTHRVRVTYVDNGFQVDEINDCNNTTGWVTFTVLPANLEGRLTARSVASGATVATTSFSIRNIGSIAVPSVAYRITIGGVQVASSTLATPVPVSTTWSTVTVPITWNAPIVSSNQNLPYVLEITDPSQGLEATTSVMTVIAPPATPRLFICPNTVSLVVGATSSLSARYWSNLLTIPSCATGGYTTVTNSATWTSSAPATASVTNSGTRGIVTGVALGNSTVTATYSGLSATAAVSVATATTPISITILPQSRFVRSGDAATLRITINANGDFNCTVRGVAGAPANFTHTASAVPQNYDQFATRPLSSTQEVTVSCVSVSNPTQIVEESITIEVIPVVEEV
jgi:hypothetical protein